MWDVASGNVLHVLGPHSGCGRVLAFSEDDTQLTTATSQGVYVWELKSGELMGIRERDTQVNDAPKRPYSAFTFRDIEQSQELQYDSQVSRVLSQVWQQTSQLLQGLLQLLPQEGQEQEEQASAQEEQGEEGEVQEVQEVQESVQEEEQEEQHWRQVAQQVVQQAAHWHQMAQQVTEWQARQQQEEQQARQQAQAQAQELAQAAGDSDHAKWLTKYLGWRLPRGYRVATTLVMEDRVVHLCKDGRVLILDTSRMESESQE